METGWFRNSYEKLMGLYPYRIYLRFEELDFFKNKYIPSNEQEEMNIENYM